MIPIDITEHDSALEHYFDEHIDLNSPSSHRGKNRARENSTMAEDFEITGSSFPAGSSLSSHKRRRIEHDPRNSPDRSASSSPLNEVEACVKCGCTCAGIYRTKGKEGVELEMSGIGKKGRWGGLSKDVSANILGELTFPSPHSPSFNSHPPSLARGGGAVRRLLPGAHIRLKLG